MNQRIKRLQEAIGRGARRIGQIRHNNKIRRQIIKRLRREHRVTVMFDSITLDQIPASAPAVAGYVGGNWPTYNELASRFPGARRLSIAVSSREDAECLDVEPGDATPAVAAGWVKRQLARGVKKPVVYSSVSGMDALLAELARAGISRNQIRVWTAHYSFTPHLCGPHSCGQLHSTTADATQWTDSALGRNLDESVTTLAFWG